MKLRWVTRVRPGQTRADTDSRQALSELLNERTGVSVEMAIRLAKAFGSSPDTWLRLQMAFDLWKARGRARQIRVKRFLPA